MRRLLKIPLAGAVIAIARMLLRRLLDGEDRQAGEAYAPPPARPRSTQAARATARKQRTREDLYKEAVRLDIRGRSKMNKRQLQEAVEDARIGGGP